MTSIVLLDRDRTRHRRDMKKKSAGRRERPGIQSVEIGSRILAAMTQAAQPLQLHLEDEGVVMDTDTLADLARAEALLAQRAGS